MPRIDAPTVAEHRAARVRALLDATRSLLGERPDEPPALGEVAARAGLSRSSVYQYFDSREDLLAALAEDVLPRWNARVESAVDAADGPAEQVLAYTRATLELVADGEHALARALAVHAPAGALAPREEDVHDRLTAPVRQALARLDLRDPAATAELVNAVVHTAMRMVEAGTPVEAATERVGELLGPFLRR